MVFTLISILMSSPVVTVGVPPAEPPAAVAQRAAAEALLAEKHFVEAGDAYFKLAEMPGVDRRVALDRAHESYDNDYMVTRRPRSLCWALGVAETVVEEGGFADSGTAEFWQDVAQDDL